MEDPPPTSLTLPPQGQLTHPFTVTTGVPQFPQGVACLVPEMCGLRSVNPLYSLPVSETSFSLESGGFLSK